MLYSNCQYQYQWSSCFVSIPRICFQEKRFKQIQYIGGGPFLLITRFLLRWYLKYLQNWFKHAIWFHWQLSGNPVVWCGRFGGVHRVGFGPLMYSYHVLWLIHHSPFEVNSKVCHHAAQLIAWNQLHNLCIAQLCLMVHHLCWFIQVNWYYEP